MYVEQGLSQVSHQAPLLVIDGPQRLTTVSLLLAALAQALGDTEPVDGFSAAKLRHYFLSNPLEAGDRYYKLLPSQTDNASLKAIVKNTELPKDHSICIANNFRLFTELLAAHKDVIVAVCQGLAKLVVVDIALSRDQDNPREPDIYEAFKLSFRAKAKDGSPGYLVKCFAYPTDPRVERTKNYKLRTLMPSFP